MCSYAPLMADPTLILTMCAPAGDDPYFAEISFEVPGVSYVWAEVVLGDVDISAEGADRVADARVLVRAYSDDHHVEIPYEEAISVLERAKLRLLEGEVRVPPGQD